MYNSYPNPNAIKNEANIIYLPVLRSYNHPLNLFKSTALLNESV